MSEPHDPFGGAGESAPAAQQPAPLPTRAWGREGRGAVAIGLAGALLLVVALVATGPLWAPLLPWAARNEPAPDAGIERQPAEGAASAALQGLDRRVAALEARPAAPGSDLAGIRQEVARLAARIEAIDQATHNQAVGDPTDIALVLALLQIRDAIEAGRPFAPAYEALAVLARSRPEIDGRPCVPSIDDLPMGVDAAVLVVPQTAAIDAITACEIGRASCRERV